METLHPELFSSIFSLLDTSTTLNASLVCKGWNSTLGTRPCTTKDYLLCCARDGNIPYLEAMRDMWSAELTEVAAESGQLECLEHLLENGCPWEVSAIHAASSSGNLSCLKYLHEESVLSTCELGSDSYSVTCRDDYEATCHAVGGRRGPSTNAHLACLIYLHKCGYGIGPDTATTAAECGDLECLRYLLEVAHCYCGRDAVEAAKKNGHEDCAKYLQGFDSEYMYRRFIDSL